MLEPKRMGGSDEMICKPPVGTPGIVQFEVDGVLGAMWDGQRCVRCDAVSAERQLQPWFD